MSEDSLLIKLGAEVHILASMAENLRSLDWEFDVEINVYNKITGEKDRVIINCENQVSSKRPELTTFLGRVHRSDLQSFIVNAKMRKESQFLTLKKEIEK